MGSRAATTRRPTLRLLLGLVLGTTALLTATTPAAAAASAVSVPPGGGCADVEVIGARGTTEPPGFGFLLGPQAEDIQARLAQTVSLHALDYPAGPSFGSVADGIAAMQDRLTANRAPARAPRSCCSGTRRGRTSSAMRSTRWVPSCLPT